MNHSFVKEYQNKLTKDELEVLYNYLVGINYDYMVNMIGKLKINSMDDLSSIASYFGIEYETYNDIRYTLIDNYDVIDLLECDKSYLILEHK